MLYDKDEAARLQRSLLWVSCAALAIASLASWAGTIPTGAMCGSALLPGSAGQWMLSVIGWWILMIIAMMAPVLVQPLMHVKVSSFGDRRWRSSVLFVSAYAAVWLVAGVTISFVLLIESRFATSAAVVFAINLLVALIWQASPFKQRCLNRGHAHPSLSAFGLQADLDSLHFGFEHGIWCVGSCWALMLAAASLDHSHLVAMLVVGVLMYCERMEPPAAVRWRMRGLRTAHLRLRQAVRTSLL